MSTFLALRDWRTALYRGNPENIERFLDAIDTTLPAGWIRDRDYERSRPRSNQIRCYLHDQAGDVAMRVWLQRITARRVRGGPIQILRYSPSDISLRSEELVAQFTDFCVLPAAGVSGVLCMRPTFGPRSALTPDAESLFTGFADAADGEWPLSDRSRRLWEKLVAVCLHDGVAIDRTELSCWLADNGWNEEAVRALTDQFFTDSEWLVKRQAELGYAVSLEATVAVLRTSCEIP